jgi:hypothetical protein
MAEHVRDDAAGMVLLAVRGKPADDMAVILEDLIKDGKVKFENKVFWGVDLASEHEKHLTEKVFGGLIILNNYPKLRSTRLST